jgi:hypothetical protein
MEVTNTLAFYDTITAVKGFIVLAPDKMFRVELRPMLQFFTDIPSMVHGSVFIAYGHFHPSLIFVGTVTNLQVH